MRFPICPMDMKFNISLTVSINPVEDKLNVGCVIRSLSTQAQEANLKCRGHAVLCEAVLKKKKGKVVSPQFFFSKCASLDYKIKPFSKVYNILSLFSDLTNPSVQYSIYVEIRLYCQETARTTFCACCSLFENLHQLCTEPSHCHDFDHLIVYFNRKCMRLQLRIRLMQRRGCLTFALLPENEAILS